MINNPGIWMFEVLRMFCYSVATRDRVDDKMQYGFGFVYRAFISWLSKLYDYINEYYPTHATAG